MSRIGEVYIWPEEKTVLLWFQARITGTRGKVEAVEKLIFKKLRSWLEKNLSKLGYKNIKFRWSRKAGCPCGCSPGFIINASHPRKIYSFYIGSGFRRHEVPAIEYFIDVKRLRSVGKGEIAIIKRRIREDLQKYNKLKRKETVDRIKI
ncbi:MAG: hypothetical protein ACTSPL_03980 [Candidatus Odinarchaeia archaeon]